MNIIHTKVKVASEAVYSFGVSASNTLSEMCAKISKSVGEIFSQVKEYLFGKQPAQITFQATDVMGGDYTSDESYESYLEKIAVLKPIVSKMLPIRDAKAVASLLRAERSAAKHARISKNASIDPKAAESATFFASFAKTEERRKETAEKRADELARKEADALARKEQMINGALALAITAITGGVAYTYIQNKQEIDSSIAQDVANFSKGFTWGVNTITAYIPSAETIQRSSVGLFSNLYEKLPNRTELANATVEGFQARLSQVGGMFTRVSIR